jgi:hypothetical protein
MSYNIGTAAATTRNLTIKFGTSLDASMCIIYSVQIVNPINLSANTSHFTVVEVTSSVLS